MSYRSLLPRSGPGIILPVAFMINILLCIILFATIREDQIPVYFNSDTLYVPSIYHDLFIDGNSFAGWHLNGAPNIFPDMIMYFIIQIFFNSFIPAMLTYSFLEFILLMLLLMYGIQEFF